MCGSSSSPLESDGFNCPSCGNAVQFGADSSKLEHVDGSPMCAPGKETVKLFPVEFSVPPVEVSGELSASAQRANERAERRAAAERIFQDETEPFGTGSRGAGWLSVAALFFVLVAVIVGCFWYVWANWPGAR